MKQDLQKLPDYADSVLPQNASGVDLNFLLFLVNTPGDTIALGNQNRPLQLPSETAYGPLLISEQIALNGTPLSGTRTFDRLIERPVFLKSVKSKIIAHMTAPGGGTVTPTCRLQIQRITGQGIIEPLFDSTINGPVMTSSTNYQFNFDQVSLERLIQYYDLIRVIITVTCTFSISNAGNAIELQGQELNADRSQITMRVDPYAVGDRVR